MSTPAAATGDVQDWFASFLDDEVVGAYRRDAGHNLTLDRYGETADPQPFDSARGYTAATSTGRSTAFTAGVKRFDKGCSAGIVYSDGDRALFDGIGDAMEAAVADQPGIRFQGWADRSPPRYAVMLEEDFSDVSTGPD